MFGLQTGEFTNIRGETNERKGPFAKRKTERALRATWAFGRARLQPRRKWRKTNTASGAEAMGFAIVNAVVNNPLAALLRSFVLKDVFDQRLHTLR